VARLFWNVPGGESRAFELENATYRVGRGEECEIVIDEPLVSRVHARIEWRDAMHVLVDLDSTNFTRVNDERLAGERVLHDGDRIRFARASCTFEA
jgi:pSer/pThr/pTyr-binding forkhead associated (FHA) protein